MWEGQGEGKKGRKISGNNKIFYHEFKLPVVERSSTLSSVCHHCELDSLTLVLEGATYRHVQRGTETVYI